MNIDWNKLATGFLAAADGADNDPSSRLLLSKLSAVAKWMDMEPRREATGKLSGMFNIPQPLVALYQRELGPMPVDGPQPGSESPAAKALERTMLIPQPEGHWRSDRPEPAALQPDVNNPQNRYEVVLTAATGTMMSRKYVTGFNDLVEVVRDQTQTGTGRLRDAYPVEAMLRNPDNWRRVVGNWNWKQQFGSAPACSIEVTMPEAPDKVATFSGRPSLPLPADKLPSDMAHIPEADRGHVAIPSQSEKDIKQLRVELEELRQSWAATEVNLKHRVRALESRVDQIHKQLGGLTSQTTARVEELDKGLTNVSGHLDELEQNTKHRLRELEEGIKNRVEHGDAMNDAWQQVKADVLKLEGQLNKDVLNLGNRISDEVRRLSGRIGGTGGIRA